MRRSEPLMAVPVSKASWASSGRSRIMSLRSPPAKKVFLAEVKTMPRMESRSASARSAIAAMESLKAWFIVLADWPGSSRTRVTTPVSSCSQRIVVDSLMFATSVSEVGSGIRTDQMRSTMVATPMPPPTHRVTSP